MSAGHAPDWGWHRLSGRDARRLVADAGIRRGDLVLDIGAGEGSITAPLVAAGARVIAIELHPQRAHELRRRFAADRVTVVRTDAADLRLPRQPFRVVANPPFAITSPLLRRLLSPGSRMLDARLVVQRHAATRWTNGAIRGARRWTDEFDIRTGRPVARAAFDPRPPVDCAELVIRRRVHRRR